MTNKANDFFAEPDFVKDEQFLEDEKKKQGYEDGRSWWRPKPKSEFSGLEKFNRIRIFPAVKGSEHGWYIAGAKHWMNFSDAEKGEPVTCMKHTYGTKCLACEKMNELKAAGAEKEQVEAWRPRRVGLLQLIDRANQNEGPQLYECPRMTVLNVIINLGRYLFDTAEGFGSDLMLTFDKALGPRAYTVGAMPNGNIALGTSDELEAWIPKLVDMDKEKFYPSLTEAEQYILFFEGKEMRDALRDEIRDRTRVEPVVEEKPAVVSKPAPAPKVEPKPAVVEEKKEVSPIKEEAPKEEAPKAAPKATIDMDKIKQKLADLKAKKGA